MKVLSFGVQSAPMNRPVAKQSEKALTTGADILQLNFSGSGTSGERLLAQILARIEETTNWKGDSVTGSGGSYLFGRQVSFKLDGSTYTLRQVNVHRVAQREGMEAGASIKVEGQDGRVETFSLDGEAYAGAITRLLEIGNLKIKDSIRATWLDQASQAREWQIFETDDSQWVEARLGTDDYKLSRYTDDGRMRTTTYHLSRVSNGQSPTFAPQYELSRQEYEALFNRLSEVAVSQLSRTHGLGDNLDPSPILRNLLRQAIGGEFVPNARNSNPEAVDVSLDGARILLRRSGNEQDPKYYLFIKPDEEAPSVQISLKGVKARRTAALLFEVAQVERQAGHLAGQEIFYAGREAELLARLREVAARREANLAQLNDALPQARSALATRALQLLDADNP